MREIRTSGLMSGDGKRSVAAWPKPPRPSSTLRAPRRRVSPVEEGSTQRVVGAADEGRGLTVASGGGCLGRDVQERPGLSKRTPPYSRKIAEAPPILCRRIRLGLA